MDLCFDLFHCRLLVGAPFEKSGKNQTGDVYKCPLASRADANCSRLNLGAFLDSSHHLLSHFGTMLFFTEMYPFVCLVPSWIFPSRRDILKECFRTQGQNEPWDVPCLKPKG